MASSKRKRGEATSSSDLSDLSTVQASSSSSHSPLTDDDAEHSSWEEARPVKKSRATQVQPENKVQHASADYGTAASQRPQRLRQPPKKLIEELSQAQVESDGDEQQSVRRKATSQKTKQRPAKAKPKARPKSKTRLVHEDVPIRPRSSSIVRLKVPLRWNLPKNPKLASHGFQDTKPRTLNDAPSTPPNRKSTSNCARPQSTEAEAEQERDARDEYEQYAQDTEPPIAVSSQPSTSQNVSFEFLSENIPKAWAPQTPVGTTGSVRGRFFTPPGLHLQVKPTPFEPLTPESALRPTPNNRDIHNQARSAPHLEETQPTLLLNTTRGMLLSAHKFEPS